MHLLNRQQGFTLKVGFALALTFFIFTGPAAFALLRGIGGVPPAPASRREGPQCRTGDLPPISTIHGDES
jgi:hypothetical protein